jgi:Chaperone of endosialidase
MTQQIINVGPAPNDGQGDPIRTAFIKTNDNFSQLYSRAQSSPPPTLTGSIGDQAGMYAYDSTYFYYCFENYTGNSNVWAQVTQVSNISLAEIQSGSSNVAIVGPSANITVGVNGTSNVAVFSTTGVYANGLISAVGNVYGSYILGNGSQLTGLPQSYSNANVITLLSNFGSNVVVTTGNVSAGNLLTLGAVSASGNVTGNYILGNGSQLTGLPATYTNANVVTLLSAFGSNTISTTGNITSGNVSTSGQVSATGNITSQGNISSQGIVSATGNIVTSGYFVGTFVGNVTGNFVIPGANTQVVFNTNGNADAVGGMTYNKDSNTFTVLGIVSSQGNVVAGNVTTAGQVSATGNITGGNVNATNYTGTTVSVTGAIQGANLNVSGNINGASLIGTIATASQPAITTVGTLTSLSVAANVTGGNILTSGIVSATGNITGGNILTGGIVSATGNITGGQVSAFGDVTGYNIKAANTISASGNVTGNYLKSTLDVIVGGNISTTNLTGSGVSVTGNISGSYILGNGSQLTGLPQSYTNSNVSSFLSAFGSNSISTTGTVTSSSTVGGVITGSTASLSGNITAANLIVINATYSGGMLAEGAYTGPYPDGTVVDYVTGNGRISTNSFDGIQFFNNGLANTYLGGFTPVGTFSATGNVVGGQSLIVGNLTITANSISSSTQNITIGQAGNIGNIIIAGNLQVLGNTTTFNSNSVTTNDLAIYVANNASSSSLADGAGFGVGAGGTYGTFLFNNSGNVFASSLGLSVAGNITGGNVAATNLTGSNVSVTGRVTAASTVGGVITGASASVTGTVTAASTVGGVITGSSASVTGTVTGASLAGTITTASQTNITAVGSLGNTQISSLGVGTAATGTNGEIVAINNITAYYSDARLKDFLGTIPNALDKVMSLNGYYFTENAKAKELGYNNLARQVGVSAQEVQEVLPEVVVDAPINANFEGADYKTVHYEKLIPLLIEAIKEQQKQIDALKNK